MTAVKFPSYPLRHYYGVSTQPLVVISPFTGRSTFIRSSKPTIVRAHGHQFFLLRKHIKAGTADLTPYTGKWPRLKFWTLRVLEMVNE